MSEFVPNPRRTSLKGQPDFTTISDRQLKEYQDVIQAMIFAYSHYDKEVTEVLRKVWKQISNNLTDRLNYDTMQSHSVDTSDVVMSDDLVRKSFQKPKRIKVLKSI